MVKMLCFDMDGTIADLYGVDNWLAKLRAEDATPYREARPLYDMEELNFILTALSNEDWEIRIISWLCKNASTKYSKEVRAAKREWLTRYRFPADKIHLISYGATKANCIRKAADTAILIDDDAKIRHGWHLGDTIDPLNEDLIDRLTALLN